MVGIFNRNWPKSENHSSYMFPSIMITRKLSHSLFNSLHIDFFNAPQVATSIANGISTFAHIFMPTRTHTLHTLLQYNCFCLSDYICMDKKANKFQNKSLFQFSFQIFWWRWCWLSTRSENANNCDLNQKHDFIAFSTVDFGLKCQY